MARFSDEFLYELRMKCDIEQIISMYVNIKRRGKNLVGLCPFHNEKTPSFTVYPETQSYFCFGCGAGGEVINFIRKAENLDYFEAVKFLCDKCGMTLPSDGADNSLSEKRRRMYEINKEAARFFNSVLFSEEGKKGLEYYKARGLKKSTITKFGLGYAPDSWDSLLKHMRTKGYSYEELYEANLAYKSTKSGSARFFDAFRARVMVPIIDVRGNVVAFGGRVLDDSKPKYINSSDTLIYKKSLGVFGLNFAKNSKENTLILVEGYMDAISLHQAGFTNVIACLGTAFTGEMAHLLSRYAEEIILCYDADEAGQKATNRAIEILNSIGMKLRVVRLNGGKDPDEILKNYGPERFRTLVEGAANDIEFELLRLRSQFDLATSDGKMKYLENVAVVLSKNSKIAQDIYASRLAEELGVDKKAILLRTEQIARRNRTEHNKKHFKNIQQTAMSDISKMALSNDTDIKVIKAQEMLISCLANSPDFYRYIKDDISSEDFSIDTHKKIFSVLVEKINNQTPLDFTYFSQDFTDEEMSLFVRLCKNAEQMAITLKACTDCIDVIKQSKQQATTASAVGNMSDEDFAALFKKKKNEQNADT